MVVVSISETYDLHTIVDKMSVICIHSPRTDLIAKTYPGLVMNCRYWRVTGIDVTLSTAQQLPLGVDQIGLDTGQIRPQDMMNPILYKAVSNDSWSTLEGRIMGMLSSGGTAPLTGSMATVENEHVTGIADEHGIYYSLLANSDGFRIAHPQQGLQMKNLVPLVFEKYYTHGENYTAISDSAPGLTTSNDNVLQISQIPAGALRGRPHPMPKLNTTYITGAQVGTAGAAFQYNGIGNGLPANSQISMPVIQPVACGAIILPPVSATTGILYYRMVVRAYIEFTDIRPITEIASFANLNSSYPSLVYHTDYEEQSKQMDETTDMVDVKNASIEKIMEGR